MTRSSKKTTTPRKSPAVKLAVVPAAELPPVVTEAPADAVTAIETGAGAGDDETGAAAQVMVKKKDFVDRVVAASGAKKPVARDLTEAVLKVLGEALSKGESLVLPPLGKLRVARQLDKSGGEVLQIKLKRMSAEAGAKKAEKTGADPLAEADD